MYLPFLISLHQNKLKKRAESLAQRKKGMHTQPVKGIRSASIEVNDVCRYFNNKSKSTIEKIKSFIPCTKMFRLRLMCAERINHLNHLLDKVEVAIANGKTILPKPEQVNGSRTIKKSYSDTDIIVNQKIYDSPISQPKHIKDKNLIKRPKYYTTNFRIINEEPQLRI